MTGEQIHPARRAGRVVGRWLAATRASFRPLRLHTADAIGVLQAVLYAWVGVIVAVGAERLLAVSGVVAVGVGAVGGVLLGLRQGRLRVRRVNDRRVELTHGPWFAVWLVAIALGVGLDWLL